jgi:hypothetical protein
MALLNRMIAGSSSAPMTTDLIRAIGANCGAGCNKDVRYSARLFGTESRALCYHKHHECPQAFHPSHHGQTGPWNGSRDCLQIPPGLSCPA